ncbi:MAG: TetR/AcrR family transcriptional regulator [Gammaproteobacteria bacterium]|nr:TetR/AcrR family transcriptional regulator [Gammaproteobacteria bacterium]
MLDLIHDKLCGCKRDPVKTREKLLLSAFEQIHEHGFQTVSLDAILRDTGVTKGALYHHFPNKNALGYAVVEEIISPTLSAFWIDPVLESDDPVVALQQLIRTAGETMTMEELKMGCPLNNLSQEMSAADEGFRKRLDEIYDKWRGGIRSALERGKKHNKVAGHVDETSTAAFLVASLEGCIGMAKNAQDMKILQQCGQGILDYLETLKP